MNLVRLFDDHVERLGENVLLVFEGRSFTNLQLNRMGRRLATGLRRSGLGRGDHVVVCLPNIPEVPATFQAIWRIGAVSVPVMFRLGADEIRYILSHSDARAVITSAELFEKIQEAGRGIESLEQVVVIDGQKMNGVLDYRSMAEKNPADDAAESMGKDDVAQIIYTSGTTGQPKGVMLTHGNLAANAEGVWEAFEWKKGPVSLLCLPLAHAFGVSVMTARALSPFPEGFDVLMRWFDAEKTLKLIETHRVNHFTGVPTMYQMLVDQPCAELYDTRSLEVCTIGGAPVSGKLYRAFTEKYRCPLYPGYGLTEASPGVASCRSSLPVKPGSCGIPNFNVEVKVMDQNEQILPPLEQGEIVVRGPNVMKGYYKMPEETRKAVRGGWLHTGDVGYLDEEGFLFITDRIKDLIIKGGYNIYPKEIETLLEEHPAIQEAAVIGIPHLKYGEEVAAFVVLKKTRSLAEREIIRYAKSRMTPFKCPARVFFISSMPKTNTGKTIKKELKNRAMTASHMRDD